MAGSNVVLYLLFPPKGVLQSSFNACRHFAQKGFSVFVVSNARLSDADRATLATLSFGVLERENYGYDFGGYRDGILHLLGAGLSIDKLLIMNDSVWFPTFEDEDFLDHVSATKADLYGAVMSQRKADMQQRHLQSYAVAFGRSLLNSKDFSDFWQEMSISSNRQWTIQNCEIRLTTHFRDLGYSIDARWGIDGLKPIFDFLSDVELKQLLLFESQLAPHRTAEISTVLETYGNKDWRQDVINYVETPRFRKQIMLLYPIAIQRIKFPFVKKSREQYYKIFRPQYADMLRGQCQEDTCLEIAGWDKH